MTHTCNQHSGGRSTQSYIVKPRLKKIKSGEEEKKKALHFIIQ